MTRQYPRRGEGENPRGSLGRRRGQGRAEVPRGHERPPASPIRASLSGLASGSSHRSSAMCRRHFQCPPICVEWVLRSRHDHHPRSSDGKTEAQTKVNKLLNAMTRAQAAGLRNPPLRPPPSRGAVWAALSAALGRWATVTPRASPREG